MFHPVRLLNPLWRVISLLALMALACGGLTPSQPENVLIGQWQRDDGQETIEFSKDGAVTIEILGATMEGDYKLLDDTSVQMDIAVLDETVTSVFEFRLVDDHLTLTNEEGTSATYERLK